MGDINDRGPKSRLGWRERAWLGHCAHLGGQPCQRALLAQRRAQPDDADLRRLSEGNRGSVSGALRPTEPVRHFRRLRLPLHRRKAQRMITGTTARLLARDASRRRRSGSMMHSSVYSPGATPGRFVRAPVAAPFAVAGFTPNAPLCGFEQLPQPPRGACAWTDRSRRSAISKNSCVTPGRSSVPRALSRSASARPVARSRSAAGRSRR